ncbi:MAG: leucine-rich repeat protein, partial [Bacteroidales bacterium]|nr:leucine-rich repeat protein [Bacteroidales bacterium]
FLILLSSCAGELEIPVQERKTVQFKAGFENTRTILADGNRVDWVSGDKVTIFDGESNVVATAASSGESTVLNAEISSEGPWYAIYPYREGNVISGGIITTVLEPRQTAVPGTFAPGLNISVVYSGTKELYFRNVVAFLKITVGQDLIRQIAISGTGGEAVAGTMDISWNGGTPTCTVKDEISEIILAPESGCFQPGCPYYAAVLPGTLKSGLKLIYTDAFGDSHEISSPNPPTFKRSVITDAGTPDSRFQIDGPIDFACPAVKADLLASDFGKAKFGKIREGEIYKSEAASVTYDELNAYACTATGTKESKTYAASELWSNAAAITSFDELRYFIGLYKTNLSSPEFRLPTIMSQCTGLTSVKLPYNLSTIEAGTFQGCSSLTKIELPENYRAVFGYTFAQCTSLESLDLPNVKSFSSYACIGCGVKTVTMGESCTSIGDFAFQNCKSMTRLNIPASPRTCMIESIGQYAFDGCENMSLASRNLKYLKTLGQYAFRGTKVKNMTIPLCTSIGRNAFYGCQALVDVLISVDLKEIPQFCFSGCKSLTGLTYLETNKAGGIELPEGLTSVGTAAFGGCTKIKKVVMPSTIDKLDKNIFRSQKTNLYVDLETWIVKAVTPPSLGEDTFLINGTSRTGTVAKLLVPSESVAAYKSAPQWSSFSGVTVALDITSSTALLTVKGTSVDVRTWGLEGSKHTTVFPIDKTAKTLFPDVTGNLPAEIKYSRYATSFKTVTGIESVKASAATTITIATPAILDATSGWIKTDNTMKVSGTEYFFYTKKYTQDQAASSQWLTIPGKAGFSTLVFNTAGDIVVDCPKPPVTIIDKASELRTITINHPNIVILPDGSYLAAQTCGNISTSIYRSTDRGLTWMNFGVVPGEFHYGGLCPIGTAVYYLGTDSAGGNIVIMCSRDNGKTWGGRTVLFDRSADEDGYAYHCAPSPWLIHRGRVYRAFSYRYDKESKRPWGTLLISAPVDADLMDSRSWTMSNILFYDNYVPSLPTLFRGEEPCVFEDRDGGLRILLRLDDTGLKEYASLFTVVDYKTIAYEKTFVMPGSSKKFQVFWDSKSGKYWSCVSPSFARDLSYGLNACQTRNAYSLISSTDLQNWKIEHTCIYSDNPYSNGYHYIDWCFDGDDIISCFRCSFDEERGMPYSAHDANGFGFFRVKNFRNASSVPTIFVDTPVTSGYPSVPQSYL